MSKLFLCLLIVMSPLMIDCQSNRGDYGYRCNNEGLCNHNLVCWDGFCRKPEEVARAVVNKKCD